jgi:NAD+ diphosphatase
MAKIPRLDRAGHLRKDTDRLMGALDAPETILVPTWRSKALIAEGSTNAVLPTVATAGPLIDRATELVWMGLLDRAHCFALDLSSLEQPFAGTPLQGRGEFADLRMVAGLLTTEEVELLAYARAMLHWHRVHQHCGLCGQKTMPREGGHVRECPRDQEKVFPRTDPAVMVLVEHEGRCVLARQPAWPAGMYSVIAGFVEPGESLEEAAIRETKEELGLEITALRYFRSQPWPFPASLMVGFSAKALSADLTLDKEELEEARWVSREELENPDGFFYPPPFSLAHHLIGAFLDEGRP